MKRFIEFMGAPSSWLAMGALMAGTQPGLTVLARKTTSPRRSKKLDLQRIRIESIHQGRVS